MEQRAMISRPPWGRVRWLYRSGVIVQYIMAFSSPGFAKVCGVPAPAEVGR